MAGDSTRRDLEFMEEALRLAEMGRGRTSPNPLVGAVVARGDTVVGRGFHQKYGGTHAERNALVEAGEKARGATLFVTLEPCCIWGKTPPCTDAIVDAGVGRVVVSMIDPNPEVSGRGVRCLRDSGIEVDIGLLGDEAEALNAPYIKFRRTGLPFVILKLAVSLDGKLNDPLGGGTWISCEASREVVHDMRSRADAVMVGIGTVLADNPELTDRRRTRGERQPARIILDSLLRIPLDCLLVRSASRARTIVAASEGAAPAREDALRDLDVEVWRFPSLHGRLDLGAVLKRAGDNGLIGILSEGGAAVATSLMRDRLVDRAVFFVAPVLLGSSGLPALGDLGLSSAGHRLRLENIRWTEVGCDAMLEASVVAPKR